MGWIKRDDEESIPAPVSHDAHDVDPASAESAAPAEDVESDEEDVDG